MVTSRFPLALVLGLILFIAAGGCGEPDRAQHRDYVAEQVCREAERCDNLGHGGLHDSYDDCIIEEQKRFNDIWPENRCGDGRMDADAVDRCLDRALDVACDGNWADWLSAADRCNADTVCTN